MPLVPKEVVETIDDVTIYSFECPVCGAIFSSDIREEAAIQAWVHLRTAHKV